DLTGLVYADVVEDKLGPQSATSNESVDQAIVITKDVILKSMKGDNWEASPKRDPSKPPHEIDGGQWGGVTALATYALLSSGERAESGHMRPAIEWLKKADIKGVYALGMRMQVW